MPPRFDARDFITRLGESLLREFDDAKQGTTGPLIGTAIETPARRRLQQVLPRGIAVGSGCVIDSYGGCSKQQDIILYEKNICPVFSVNETPETAYYPCEGVLGVVEVKSSLDTASLRDSFEKVSSVRRLRRYGIPDTDPEESGSQPGYRRYQSTTMANLIRFADSQSVQRFGLDQMFGAVLAGSLRMQPRSLHTSFMDLSAEYGDDATPSVVAVLGSGVLLPCLMEAGAPRVLPSPKSATHFLYSESDALRALIDSIYVIYREGVTSEAESFDRYIVGGVAKYEGDVLPKGPTSRSKGGGSRGATPDV